MKKQQIQTLLETTGITIPPIGVFDVDAPEAFAPFCEPGNCIFGDFNAWTEGKSTMIGNENAASFDCPGAGYWLCGIQAMPREAVAGYLAGQEGLKASPQIKEQWLDTHPPHVPENKAVVISQLMSAPGLAHYEAVKTVTFFVRPDQLALLITGAEYFNAAPDHQPVKAVYGSGCGQMLCLFENFDTPKAMIGATDIAMRKYLPADVLALTVTKPMFEQLCNLDEKSFLHKTFWNELREARGQV